MPVSDTTITSWSTTPADNSPARSDQIGGLLDDQFRNIRSVVRSESENKQWVRLALTPTYVAANQFSVPGDERVAFAVGRRVKLALSGSTKYGTISARNFSSAVTTVTVQFDLETFDDAAWSVASDDSIEVTGDYSSTFAVGTECEFYTLAALDQRIAREVSAVSFGGGVTTVDLTAGHFLSSEDVLLVNRGAIDNTVSDVQLGAFTPALFQSGWPNTVVAGQFQITADNTAGPFLIALPWRQADSDYVPLIQPTDASSTPSGVQWAIPFVSSRNTTHFGVQFSTAITTGPVLTYDYVIMRGQP